MATIDRAEYAAELKNYRGYNCCQAVTAALADETDMPKDQLKMISTGFCVGMGAMEATCGALIGAGMIAGLKTEGSRTLIYTKQIVDESDAETSRESIQVRFSVHATIALGMQSALTKQLCRSIPADRPCEPDMHKKCILMHTPPLQKQIFRKKGKIRGVYAVKTLHIWQKIFIIFAVWPTGEFTQKSGRRANRRRKQQTASRPANPAANTN